MPRKKIEKPCSEEGCERNARARGMCSAHYQRWAYRNIPGRKEAVIAANLRYKQNQRAAAAEPVAV